MGAVQCEPGIVVNVEDEECPKVLFVSVSILLMYVWEPITVASGNERVRRVALFDNLKRGMRPRERFGIGGSGSVYPRRLVMFMYTNLHGRGKDWGDEARRVCKYKSFVLFTHAVHVHLPTVRERFKNLCLEALFVDGGVESYSCHYFALTKIGKNEASLAVIIEGQE